MQVGDMAAVGAPLIDIRLAEGEEDEEERCVRTKAQCKEAQINLSTGADRACLGVQRSCTNQHPCSSWYTSFNTPFILCIENAHKGLLAQRQQLQHRYLAASTR